MKRALCTVFTALILLSTAAVPALAENALSKSIALETADEAILLPEFSFHAEYTVIQHHHAYIPDDRSL